MRKAQQLADEETTDRLWAQFHQREPTIEISADELEHIALTAEPVTECDQPWTFKDH